MERRSFLKGALAIFGAVTVGVAASSNAAEAASLDAVKDLPRVPEGETVEATSTAEPDAEGQYYVYRRRYRPRRRVYYYRPRRRVYYYRPRRVYYRPVYYRRYW